uniref:Chromate resistance exported protein n=1 Tax=Mycobacterium riyadhense TaxID=486698 RepID=A0A653F1E3_9MYCO|nr:chromate resistance protein ChrB domain-containing protein [Mycobacterium riyadhense]VTP02792.1 Chromate resistance exported protein [Mycobacterium riyadhense]
MFAGYSDQVPVDAIALDMRAVELSHYNGDCTFETVLRRCYLTDPVFMAGRRDCAWRSQTASWARAG